MKKFHLVLLGILLSVNISFSVSAQIRLGVCTSVKNAEKVKAAGGHYIEENVSGFLMPFKSDAEFESNIELAKASPLPIYACNGFYPSEIKLTGTDRNHEQALKYAETAFKRAHMIGIKRIVLGSSKSRNCPEGYDKSIATKEFIDLLKEMGPIAKKYDIVVVIEPLNKNETNMVNTVAEGVAIVKQVKHKNIQCLADFYHMLIEDESPEILVKEKKHIYHCHVAEKEGRSVPGTHNEDLTPYYNALIKAGYKGGLSIEARWIEFDNQVVSGLANLKERTIKDRQ